MIKLNLLANSIQGFALISPIQVEDKIVELDKNDFFLNSLLQLGTKQKRELIDTFEAIFGMTTEEFNDIFPKSKKLTKKEVEKVKISLQNSRFYKEVKKSLPRRQKRHLGMIDEKAYRIIDKIKSLKNKKNNYIEQLTIGLAVTGGVGIGFGIVGLVLSPFTLGTSTVLNGIGSAFGVASVGVSIGIIVERSELRKLNKFYEDFLYVKTSSNNIIRSIANEFKYNYNNLVNNLASEEDSLNKLLSDLYKKFKVKVSLHLKNLYNQYISAISNWEDSDKNYYMSGLLDEISKVQDKVMDIEIIQQLNDYFDTVILSINLGY